VGTYDVTEEFARGMQKRFWEEIGSITGPFSELQEIAGLLNKQNTESYTKAGDAYVTALRNRKDPVLKAIAFAAFGQCYTDMGLEEKADEMTQKRQELALRYS